MVWKSDRWQTSVEKADVHGDSKVEAGTLEISYHLPGKGIEKELVYQDTAEAEGGPRLLVSLASVMKLKGLCEHEHAKHDKALTALKVCRLKYFKEIRWLRDQLQRHTGKDGDVFWFDPEEGSDLEGLQNHMLMALQEDNERLKQENAALNEELSSVKAIIEEMSDLKEALRRMLKDHTVREVTTELRGVLAKANHLSEFTGILRELLPELSPQMPSGPDPEEFARLGEELLMMRRRSESHERGLDELRQQADKLRGELQAKATELRSEKERADLERLRAEKIQKRVEQMDLVNKTLSQEMEAKGDDAKAASARELRAVQLEADKLRTELSGGALRINPLALRFLGAVKRLAGEVTPADSAVAHSGSEGDLGQAIAHLDSVACNVEDGVQRVLSELRELRLRTQEQDEEIRELKARGAAGADASAAHQRDLQELQDRITRLQEELAEMQRGVDDRAAQDMQRRELVETLRMEACELRQRFGDRLTGLEGERSRLQRKVERLEGRLRDLANAPSVADDFGEFFEEEEAQIDSASVSPKASARRSARDRWFADRPRMVLAEDDAAAALAFLGSGADQLQRVIATCVQVRRFVTPGASGPRETWSGRGHSRPSMASGRSSSPKHRSVDAGPAGSRRASSDGFGDGGLEAREKPSRAAWKPGGAGGAKEEVVGQYMGHGPDDSPKHRSDVSHKSSWKPSGASAAGAKAQGGSQSMYMSHGPYEAPAQRSRSEKVAAWKPGGAGAKDLSQPKESLYLGQGPPDVRAQRSDKHAPVARQPPRRAQTGVAVPGEGATDNRSEPGGGESRRPPVVGRGRSADGLPRPADSGQGESRARSRRRTVPAIADKVELEPVTIVKGEAVQGSPRPTPKGSPRLARSPTLAPASEGCQEAPRQQHEPAPLAAARPAPLPQASQDGAPQRQAPAAAVRADAAHRSGMPQQARQAPRRAAPPGPAGGACPSVLLQASFPELGAPSQPLQAPHHATSRSRSQNRSRDREHARSKSPTPPSTALLTITGGGGGWQGAALPRRPSPHGSPRRGAAAAREASPFAVPSLSFGRAPSPPRGQQPLQGQLRRQPAAPAGPAGPAAAAMQALQQGAALLPGAAPALQALQQALQGANLQQGASPALSWSRRPPEEALGAGRQPLQAARGQHGQVQLGLALAEPREAAQGQWLGSAGDWRPSRRRQPISMFTNTARAPGAGLGLQPGLARSAPVLGMSAPQPLRHGAGGGDRKLPALSPSMRAAMGRRAA